MTDFFRNLYSHYRMRRKYRHWDRADDLRLEFYRQFISSGDLVYDVGANIGNRTKIFLRLGARVVAVEPQDLCADFLERELDGEKNFTLVRTALGAEKGTATMRTSKAHTLSTLSPDWISATRESGRFESYEWGGEQKVEVDTLNNLIDRYGMPEFVKIDVEGFEFEVLSGLSRPVRFLSIEFAPEFRQKTFQCLAHMSHLGSYEFQFSMGESMRFMLDRWVDENEIRGVLERIPGEDFGDVYMRRL